VFSFDLALDRSRLIEWLHEREHVLVLEQALDEVLLLHDLCRLDLVAAVRGHARDSTPLFLVRIAQDLEDTVDDLAALIHVQVILPFVGVLVEGVLESLTCIASCRQTERDHELVERDHVVDIRHAQRLEDVLGEAFDERVRALAQLDVELAKVLAVHQAIRMRSKEILQDGLDLALAQIRHVRQELDVVGRRQAERLLAQSLGHAVWATEELLIGLTHFLFCFS